MKIFLLGLLLPSVLGAYQQEWLRGQEADNDGGHPHEGIRLAARDGWVAVGETLNGRTLKVKVQMIDNEGNIVWTTKLGDSGFRRTTYSTGYSIIQDETISEKLYVGAGLWNMDSNKMEPALIALDANSGDVIWTWTSGSHSKHGGVRSVIMDGNRIIGTGYVNSPEPGFMFVADDAKPAVWEWDTEGNLIKENILDSELPQGAKIRKDKSGGYIVASTAWGELGEEEVNVAGLIKLSDDLEVEWEKTFGMEGGNTQVFDVLVDNDGNYLMGGHTTVGNGVKNWDYVALKVNSQTRDLEWRHTYGQPRGFDARYIHDEMYGVALDQTGNYLLLGGSGDEYEYSETNSEGWQSDVWVSYLVVVDPEGKTLSQGVFGDKEANNAGEYLSVDRQTGDVMIYVDSDSVGGDFAFMKLSKN